MDAKSFTDEPLTTKEIYDLSRRWKVQSVFITIVYIAIVSIFCFILYELKGNFENLEVHKISVFKLFMSFFVLGSIIYSFEIIEFTHYRIFGEHVLQLGSYKSLGYSELKWEKTSDEELLSLCVESKELCLYVHKVKMQGRQFTEFECNAMYNHKLQLQKQKQSDELNKLIRLNIE